MGLAGVRLVTNDQTNSGSGIITLKSGSNNVIIRNLIFEGPGAYDVDGLDGNFDNSHNSDNITISWNKFGYNKPAKAGGSGGSDDHRFSNLVGGSDSDYPDDGHFSITFQFNYWGNGCKSRMPKARNAELHILNNLYDTNVTDSHALGFSVGDKGVTAYVEGCNFKQVKNILDVVSGTPSVTFINCINGVSNLGSTVAKPPYSYSAIAASEVESAVTGACGAGQTLKVDSSSGSVSC
jgi:pectate lyase